MPITYAREELWFFGDIDGRIASDCFALIKNLHSPQQMMPGAPIIPPPATINLVISSYGGDLASGLALANVIAASPIPVHTHNAGHVGSVAILPFLAGRVRTASPDSVFLLHGTQGSFYGNVGIANTTIEEKHLILKEYEKIMRRKLTNAPCNFTTAEVDKLLAGPGLILDSAQALARGILT